MTSRSINEILAKKKPNRITVEVVMDAELGHKIQMKARELELAQTSRFGSMADKNPVRIQEELDDLFLEAKDSVEEFTFQDIGRRAYDALVREHPPTEEQKQQWKDVGGQGPLAWNLETFPPAIISACAVDPEIPFEAAIQIMDDWSEGDAQILLNAALAVCMERTSIPLSKLDIGKTTGSASSLTTATEPLESLDLSSLGGS